MSSDSPTAFSVPSVTVICASSERSVKYDCAVVLVNASVVTSRAYVVASSDAPAASEARRSLPHRSSSYEIPAWSRNRLP